MVIISEYSPLDLLIIFLCALLIMTGIVNIVFPFLPGLPLVWLGIFIYTIYTRFEKINLLTLGLVTLLIILMAGVELWTTKKNIRMFRASPTGVLGAFLGGMVGISLAGSNGLIEGAILGGLIGQFVAGKDILYSFRAGDYTIFGFLGGSLIQLLTGFIILALFLSRL